MFLSKNTTVVIFYWKTLNFIYSILQNVVTVRLCRCNRNCYCIGMVSTTSLSRYQSRPSMYIWGPISRNWPRQFRLTALNEEDISKAVYKHLVNLYCVAPFKRIRARQKMTTALFKSTIPMKEWDQLITVFCSPQKSVF